MQSEKETQEEPRFEDVLERLEKVVEAMESGEIPLSDLVAKFEEGSKLLKICRQHLRTADLRIEKLKEAEGTDIFEEFDGEN